MCWPWVKILGPKTQASTKHDKCDAKKNKSTHLMKSDKHKHVTIIIYNMYIYDNMYVYIYDLCVFMYVSLQMECIHNIWTSARILRLQPPQTPPPQRVACPRPPSFHLQLWDLPVASVVPRWNFGEGLRVKDWKKGKRMGGKKCLKAKMFWCFIFPIKNGFDQKWRFIGLPSEKKAKQQKVTASWRYGMCQLGP